MIKLKKNEIFIIFLLYFALIIFLARNPFIYLIHKDAITIITIFIIFALIELFFYIHNNFDLTPIIFYVSLCNSILGYQYFHFNVLYLNFSNNLPVSLKCKCDISWLGEAIRNYKINAKWIEYFTIFIITWIILKYAVFRILYLKKYKSLKKRFIIFNLGFLIIYFIISGYFNTIYSSAYSFYNNRLFSQEPYDIVIDNFHLNEISTEFSNELNKAINESNTKYKNLYSMPNDYYTQFLTWLRFK